jgi:hypothetical protein
MDLRGTYRSKLALNGCFSLATTITAAERCRERDCFVSTLEVIKLPHLGVTRRQYYCSLATHFSSRFLSLIQDILVIVGAVQVLSADTAPLLGPFSNVEYRFISALGLVIKA